MQAAHNVQHIGQMLESALNKPMPVNSILMKKQGVSNESNDLMPAMIATLWLQLTEIYGHRFTNQYGEKDSGVWFQALNDLTQADIMYGLHDMMRDLRFETWPPNCTQFRHLCNARPKLPTVNEAFNEARHNLLFSSPRRWSHPAIKFTVKYLGMDTVNSADKHNAFKIFSITYERICERIAQGRDVPEVSDEELVIKPKKSSQPIPRLAKLLRENP